VSGVASAISALVARVRQGSGGGGGTLALEQVLALDPRRRLCLVRCGTRRVLLLVGGTQDCVVGWLDAEEPGAPPS
jgi:hypothetical protein